MITQEWNNEESAAISKLGFTLNFKGYFVRDNITLTKRLDVEFNELYYQAFRKEEGLTINIPAYRVNTPFEDFLDTLKDVLAITVEEEIDSLEKLIGWLESVNVKCSYEKVEDGYVVNFNNVSQNLPNYADIEKTILYLTINFIIKQEN